MGKRRKQSRSIVVQLWGLERLLERLLEQRPVQRLRKQLPKQERRQTKKKNEIIIKIKLRSIVITNNK